MLNCQKTQFQLSEDTTYLNCAYMGPMLRMVAELGKKAIEKKLDPTLIQVKDFFQPTEELRSEFAALINCSEPERVVLIPSVSYGIANAANNLSIPEDSKIILAGEQFPSNAYPWYRVAKTRNAEIIIINGPDNTENRGKSWNQHILDAIDDSTSAVAISICHWADGTLFDMLAIRNKTKDHKAALIIDGTQSIGAMPFDWEEIRPDALICAGYKWLLGPYSLGLACYGNLFDDGVPIEENWINRKGSENFAGLVDYEMEYQPGALRYEVGEHSNFFLVPMLLASMRKIREWGPGNIQEYCRSIGNPAIRKLRESGFWIEDEGFRGSHLFGIRIPKNIDVDRVKERLSEENIFVSFRGSSIRVSPFLYNTEEDLNKLANCLISSI